eukprot:gene1-biopygen1
MIPVDLHGIGCDSFALSGHKWIGGPHETGALYLRREKLAAVAVTLIGAHSAEMPFLPGELSYVKTAARHEYGTRNAGLIVGLAAAVELQEHIGRERIATYGRELATYLLRELSQIDGITVLSPSHDEL